MKAYYILLSIAIMASSCNAKKSEINNVLPGEITVSRSVLADKIKGGWAGQVIGCTYGGPTEFQYLGRQIPDSVSIAWDSTRMAWYYQNAPGLYDDVYMDLTFVDVFEKKGFDATAQDHGEAFAHAEYMLWHANQAARYNILNGINPPQSGYWENNPHSDDIDFQIEADFACLMSPGMVNSSSRICDKVGHIMNYGDGFYGGVYVAAMYSLAFISDDIEFIVNEALKVIPDQSSYYQCMSDAILWHKKYPDDWKKSWSELQEKWSLDNFCPEGVYNDFDIDAKLNSAYILMGLLYGNGDYGKTLEIAARCGQDSDCNPASAGGILGTVLGYDAIPGYWKQGLDKVEDLDFKYTDISLSNVYRIGLNHAERMITLNGGSVEGEILSIKVQVPEPLELEQGFPGIIASGFIEPGENTFLDSKNPEYEFEFTGTGFITAGWAGKTNPALADKTLKVLITLDGNVVETSLMPTGFTTRKHDICWKYNLADGKHILKMQLLEPVKGYNLRLGRMFFYETKPSENSPK